jgi:hypothetical protein
MLHPLILRRLAIYLAVLGCIATVGCGGAMRADELKRSLETVVSSAREGELLGREAARDHTKATFTRVRARELGEEVEHEAEKIDDAEAASELTKQMQAAVALCEEIGEPLGELQTAPTDQSSAADAERALSRLAAKAERLEGSL